MPDGALCRYADVYNPQHRADMTKEISRIAGYMGDYHGSEPWLYEDCLKQNIQDRIGEYYRRAGKRIGR